jgi:hypothetical protein
LPACVGAHTSARPALEPHDARVADPRHAERRDRRDLEQLNLMLLNHGEVAVGRADPARGIEQAQTRSHTPSFPAAILTLYVNDI